MNHFLSRLSSPDIFEVNEVENDIEQTRTNERNNTHTHTQNSGKMEAETEKRQKKTIESTS